MASPELSPVEVITALTPIIGGGGLVTFLVAYLAYRTEVSKGRRGEPQQAALGGITAVMADSESFNKVADALGGVGVALTKFTLLAEGAAHDLVRELRSMNEKLNEMIEEQRRLRRSIEDRPSARSAQQAAQTRDPHET